MQRRADAVWPGSGGEVISSEEGRSAIGAEVSRLAGDAAVSRAMFEAIVSVSADGIVAVDGRQDIVLYNRGAETIFGWTADEVLGEPLHVLLPDGLAETHRAHVETFGEDDVAARHMAERRPVQGRRKDGEVFPADISISRIEVEGRTLFAAVVRDISEQKAAERERQELLDRERSARRAAEAAEWRESLLSDASRVLAGSLDYEGTLAAVTDVAVPDLGEWCICEVIAEDRAVRTEVVAATSPEREDQVRELLRRFPNDPRDATRPVGQVVASGEAVRTELLDPDDIAAFTDSGEEAELLRQLGPHVLLSVPLVARGKTLGVVTFAGREEDAFQDALADVAVELGRRAGLAVDNALLYRAARRATRARDEVLGIVAHDLRNLLHGIVMGGNLLKRRLGDAADASYQKPADAIMRSADRMGRLIDDLLDVARIESRRLSVTPAPHDPKELVHAVVEMLEPVAAGAGITLAATLDDGLPDVQADRDRVVQVLANLVGNAIKYGPPESEVRVRAAADGGRVRFSVRDHGPGISPEDVAHLFDPYWQARKNRGEGAGLGLAIARGIVEAHGGTIGVDTERGEGSTFHFTLPVASEAETGA